MAYSESEKKDIKSLKLKPKKKGFVETGECYAVVEETTNLCVVTVSDNSATTSPYLYASLRGDKLSSVMDLAHDSARSTGSKFKVVKLRVTSEILEEYSSKDVKEFIKEIGFFIRNKGIKKFLTLDKSIKGLWVDKKGDAERFINQDHAKKIMAVLELMGVDVELVKAE